MCILFAMKKLAYDISEQEWTSWFLDKKFPKYGAKQIRQWLFQKEEIDPSAFTNLSRETRQLLLEEFDWNLPTVDSILSSNEDRSEKILIKHDETTYSECVLMVEDDRVTLCVSSQVGCKLGCTFCQTGKMGFKRNLTSGEILAQVLIANKRLVERQIPKKVRNIVFMGMGEPLDNYEAVSEACKTLIDPHLFGLSKHRVTVSTSGMVPQIHLLGQEVPVSLAVSLHAATDEKRSEIMPINRKYPLAELKQALLEYPKNTRHGITFEYIMIKDLNDTLVDAKRLVKFLHGFKAKVNLIPMNPHPASPMLPSTKESLIAFQEYLKKRGYVAPIRWSRGGDVSAACGQLAAKKKDELHMLPRHIQRNRRKMHKTENVSQATH